MPFTASSGRTRANIMTNSTTVTSARSSSPSSSPPLGVFLERGCGADLLINICLTILGWIPGVIHAFYIIFKY
ncbi:stress response RCI peptide [Penicillium atrosanguineum]|nr:stress response RCI peptide [Penicillium atrosanguineum]